MASALLLAIGLVACGDFNGYPEEAYFLAEVEEAALKLDKFPSAIPIKVADDLSAVHAPVAPTPEPAVVTTPEPTVTPTPEPAAITAPEPTIAPTPVVELAEPVTSPVSGQTGSSKPATLNTLAEIENDMRLLNEGALLGVNPNWGFAKGPGHIVMGNIPRGTNTPSWFKPADTSLLTSNTWNAILPWFVFFEGVGNESTNSRIHLRNLKAWYKSKSDGQWKLLGHANDFGGANCPQTGNYAGCTGPSDKRAEPDGGVSFRPIVGMNFHGWWRLGRMAINANDIDAVFITAQIRLLQHDLSRPNDRAKAKYLVHVGADYYPTTTYNFGSQPNPGIGLSRAKMIVSDWRPANMMTFSDVGKSEPGGGIPLAVVRASPPPLD